MEFLIVLFVICVYGCRLLFKSVGNSIFGNEERKDTFIDRSVHHHYHDNRSVHVDKETFKSLK